MSELKISLGEVKACAGEIRRINLALDSTLQKVRSEMNALAGIWESEGSSVIRQRFETFSRKFDQEKSTIDEYARFLDMASESYDSLETTIRENASSFV